MIDEYKRDIIDMVNNINREDVMNYIQIVIRDIFIEVCDERGKMNTNEDSICMLK